VVCTYVGGWVYTIVGCAEGCDDGAEVGLDVGIEDGDDGDRVGEFVNPGDTWVPDPIVLVVKPQDDVCNRRLLDPLLPQKTPVSMHVNVAFLPSLL
jgi:hypothetical protein